MLGMTRVAGVRRAGSPGEPVPVSYRARHHCSWVGPDGGLGGGEGRLPDPGFRSDEQQGGMVDFAVFDLAIELV